MNYRKIFYFCYDHQKPRGGLKQIYRHVDILNNNGYLAYAVHIKKNVRLGWFENETQVIDQRKFQEMYCQETDYLVLPEDYGRIIEKFPGKKIIFNQNVYSAFNAFWCIPVRRWPYLDESVRYVMTVSRHNEEHLRFIFPGVPIRRIYYGVDKELFRYRPIRAKKKRIAILTRKNPKDTAFIYQGISARAQQGLNRLQGYTWFFVSINSEKELAKILSESLIFLFLSYSEGFGILPLEAMLSGAIVVAYNTGPYLEYLNHTNSCLVDIANRLEVIKKVEAIADAFHTQKEALARISRNAYKTAIKYSLEREEKSLLSFWREVIRSEK